MKLFCDLALDMAESFADRKGFFHDVRYGKFGIKREDVTLSAAYADDGDGLSRGNYVTLVRGTEQTRGLEEKKYFINAFAKCVEDVLVSAAGRNNGSVLVVGLGNPTMTADALGKRVADRIITTRPVKNGEIREVSSFAVSVSGITGIESYEVIEGLISRVKPNALICVDSLSAFRTDRIGRAYQVSNAGIRAGGGAGKPSKQKLDESTLGVPVIAVGVPFVVSARKMLSDAAGGDPGFDPIMPEKDMFVTPRDVDAILKDGAEIIAASLNLALHGGLSVERILAMTE